MVRRIISVLIAATLSVSSASASDTYTGKVFGIQIVDGIMHLRIILNVPMSNCDLNFAFVETSQSIYDSAVASVTTAYASGKTITLQVNRETSGFCRIFFLSY